MFKLLSLGLHGLEPWQTQTSTMRTTNYAIGLKTVALATVQLFILFLYT